MRKIILLVLLALFTLSACSPDAVDTPHPSTTLWEDGIYLVGEDIDSGLYRVEPIVENSFIERGSDAAMDEDHILATITFETGGYVTLRDTDVAVKLQGVALSPLDLEQLEPHIQTQVTPGIYLVGYDIAPGTYTAEATESGSKFGFVDRLSDAAMDYDSIISKDAIVLPGAVCIEETDHVVSVKDAILTFQPE